MDIPMDTLRTWCNQNGISCRDDKGKLLARTALLRRMQAQQVGGAMSPQKVWAKYGEALRERLAADKSYKGSLDAMPAAFTHPKHTEWIVTSYLAGGIRLYEDILARVHDVLDFHAKLFRKNILSPGTAGQPWTDERNVLNYCGLRGCTASKKGTPFKKPGLEDLLKIHSEQLASLVAPVYKPDPGTLYYEGQDVKIYKLSNQEEACYYGQGTRWCTAASKHNMFDAYNKDNELYVIVPIRPRYKGEKYQIAIQRNHHIFDYVNGGTIGDLMDEKDEEVDLNELNLLYPEITRLQQIDHYVRFGSLIRRKDIDDYTYSIYIKDSTLTVLRHKDDKIFGEAKISSEMVDDVVKKLDITQATFEVLLDELVGILTDVDAPWLAKILYPYRPTQVIPSTKQDSLIFPNWSSNNAAVMLCAEPMTLADAVTKHYGSVYLLLEYYVSYTYYINVSNDLLNIVNNVTKSHYPNTAAQAMSRALEYETFRKWLAPTEHDYTKDDIHFTVKLSEIIRRAINRILPGMDKHGLDRLEKDLHDNILRYFHQQEDKFIEKNHDYYDGDWRKGLQTIKTLYTALTTLSDKKLPPRLERYSQIAIEWLKTHKKP
jgi:hypothetical protein